MEGQSLFGLYRVVDVPGAFDQLVHARVRTLDAAVPPEVRGFLHRLLAEDPSQRPSAYQTGCLCEELAEMLPGPGLRRWARERRWPAHSKEPGPLTGQDLPETTFPVDDAPTVRRPAPLPPRSHMPPPSLPMPAVAPPVHVAPSPPAPAPPPPVSPPAPPVAAPPVAAPPSPPGPLYANPPMAPTPSPAPANRKMPPRWTPMTRPRTPSLPPGLQGWMPPLDPTPAPAGPGSAAQPRSHVPRAEAGEFVIDHAGRRGVAPKRAPAERPRRGSPWGAVGLFVAGFLLFVAAGAGTWFVMQAQNGPQLPAEGLTPTAMASRDAIDPLPDPEPRAVTALVREEVIVEPAEPPEPANDAPEPPPDLEPLQPEPEPEPEPTPEPSPPATAAPDATPIFPSRGASAGEPLEASDPGSADPGEIPGLPEEPAAEAAPATQPADLEPGVLSVQGDALVELRGEFGAFRQGTPLLPGRYEVWADFGAGLATTGLMTRLDPGRHRDREL